MPDYIYVDTLQSDFGEGFSNNPYRSVNTAVSSGFYQNQRYLYINGDVTVTSDAIESELDGFVAQLSNWVITGSRGSKVTFVEEGATKPSSITVVGLEVSGELGDNCTLEDCYINGLTQIGTGLIAKSCTLSDSVKVGPYASFYNCSSHPSKIATFDYLESDYEIVTDIHFYGYHGEIRFTSLPQGSDVTFFNSYALVSVQDCTNLSVESFGGLVELDLVSGNLNVEAIPLLTPEETSVDVTSIGGEAVTMASFLGNVYDVNVTSVAGSTVVSVDDFKADIPDAMTPPTVEEIAAGISVPTVSEVADGILTRNIASGSDGGRDVRSALRAIRNRFDTTTSGLTVYAEDDETVAWTATLTRAEAESITGVDPT